MRVEDFDFTRKYKYHGCRVCKHNPKGFCEVTGKEIPVTYAVSSGHPKWCPKGKEKE